MEMKVPILFLKFQGLLYPEVLKSFPHHDLNQILKRLKENNMLLAIDKCVFGAEQVEYLGYTVNSEGILPVKRKIDALVAFQEPKSQKEH